MADSIPMNEKSMKTNNKLIKIDRGFYRIENNGALIGTMEKFSPSQRGLWSVYKEGGGKVVEGCFDLFDFVKAAQIARKLPRA